MLLRLTMLGYTNSLMDKEYGSFFMFKHSLEMKYSPPPISYRARAVECTISSKPLVSSRFPVVFDPCAIHSPPPILVSRRGWMGTTPGDFEYRNWTLCEAWLWSLKGNALFLPGTSGVKFPVYPQVVPYIIDSILHIPFHSTRCFIKPKYT